MSMKWRDLVLTGTVWVALGFLFMQMQDDWSLNLLFGATGALWMAVPLLVTGLATRSLIAASAMLLLAVTLIFVFMIWLAVMIVGGVGVLVLGLESKPAGAVAATLLGDAMWAAPGALMGTLTGVAGRRRRASHLRIPSD